MVTKKIYPTLDQGITFVSGPTNSGKSLFAETIARQFTRVLYIATLSDEFIDNDMLKRIHVHQQRRPKGWAFLNSNQDPFISLHQVSQYELLLIDSLGGFVTSNLMLPSSEWNNKVVHFKNLLAIQDKRIILVSEEIGWGLVPTTESGSIFTERMGQLTQYFSTIAASSWLVINSTAINISEIGTPI
ncbi:bifunctional adenosylcobinamide kinase/adenosylcobinamide-phosphate guanylyltransferase [Prochlorococcus sp. MIT 1341]|uniref:bifunctional adenosylcobinamide kinase/adenosylcobinamide-phosphate guanylyltransferase n=1 Tax=Prochlorococcus sp. MIT 1341 TaxID=3096221 RepID=UPI002A75D8D4|nr:bifunctional adenosylcobinamide kinase/adenosylcobinamide-phosphate guanylyltransferase [Prochlorococcus sp. MIT 1341]